MNGAVRALALGESGTLYVGGAFTTAGGKHIPYIAQWQPEDGPVLPHEPHTLRVATSADWAAPNLAQYATAHYGDPMAGRTWIMSNCCSIPLPA